MTTHYNGSKGPVEIATMPYPHAVAARAKLIRERADDSRDAEIAALLTHIETLEIEHEAEAQTRAG